MISIKANYLIVQIEDFKIDMTIDNNFIDLNSMRFLCKIRSKLRHQGLNIYVGDYVYLEAIDFKHKTALVSSVASRESFISRPAIANVTAIIVVLSVKNPTFDLDQASRFLLAAEKTSLNIYLIITKIDLITLSKLNKHIKRLQEWGYNPIPMTIENEDDVSIFKKIISSNKLSVLCGPSGVGKSSLLKKIFPEEKIFIGSLSHRLQRGKNTTRHIEIYSLDNNSHIADSPGFNRPQLFVEPDIFPNLFPEIRKQMNSKSCKFRNCLHKDEPGCVLDKTWERYSLYRKLLLEIINPLH